MILEPYRGSHASSRTMLYCPRFPIRANEGGMDEIVFQVRVSVIRRGFDMAREAHLEAARQHLEAASKHLAAVARYNDGDVFGAERNSEEALAASQVAEGKSTEAHRQSTMAVKIKFV